jgi:glucosamine--fructose-6-phosphate aminotransferase (isomerizing)
MCGIMAYTGARPAVPLLLEGLRRLEYRGYDSAGLATVDGGRLHLRRCAGHVAELAGLLRRRPAPGCHGIGHTRWATHGRATEGNSHPQLGGDGEIAVVHNGVIENHRELRRLLEARGYVFRSETDTEILAHLIASCLEGDLVQAVGRAAPLLRGRSALAVVSARVPELIVGACLGCPLVLGIGQSEGFLASDAAALPEEAAREGHLEEGQLCVLTPHFWQILDCNQLPVKVRVEPRARCRRDEVSQFGRPHTLAEIHEQPRVIENALAGRINLKEATACFPDLGLCPRILGHSRRLVLVGCGTSYHAALLGKYLIEEFARIPAEADHASEFRYRDPPLDGDTLVVALTQSGETADTLAALVEARRHGCPTLALCNVPGSAASRAADGFLDLRAGAEVGVASTKAFTAQVVALSLLAILLGRLRRLSAERALAVLAELQALPALVTRILADQAGPWRAAERLSGSGHVLYLGRQHQYPLALEGALKLKELSYLAAQGYPAGELKHGPLALVDGQTPSVFLVPRGAAFAKTMSNLEEVKARGGPVIAVVTEGDDEVAARTDEVLPIPETAECLQPLLSVVPLQLLAYHTACLCGCNVDRPRNLAKSVTVE